VRLVIERAFESHRVSTFTTTYPNNKL